MTHKVHSFEEQPPKIAYIDPSFFINLMVKDSRFFEECKNYSQKLRRGKTVLVMSNLGLDEIWYVLLKLFAMRDYEKNWQKTLKKNPDVVKKYSEEIEIHTLELLEIPNLLLAEISVDQTMLSLNLMKKYGLFPRDAIHAAAAIASRIENVITTDGDFKRIEELEVYTCNQ